MTTSTEQVEVRLAVNDTWRRFKVEHMGGVAFRSLGYDTEEIYEGDYLICEDEDCDHMLSEMCWVEGDTSLALSNTMVKMVMVGDDTVHIVDIDDVTEIAWGSYCSECGQIGCTHDGRDHD